MRQNIREYLYGTRGLGDPKTPNGKQNLAIIIESMGPNAGVRVGGSEGIATSITPGRYQDVNIPHG
jgi:hypothetical protein